MKRLALFILVVLLCSVRVGAVIVPVRSQADFDKLRQRIIRAADSGATEVRVEFDGSLRLKFTRNMLNLSGQKYPRTSLVFSGNGVQLTGEGFTDESWTGFYSAGRKIKASGRRAGEFTLNLPDSSGPDSFSHILVTEWYQSRIYKITEIKDGKVYFSAPSADELNMDIRYSGNAPRFKLLAEGGSAPSFDEDVKGKAGRLVSTYGAAFESVVFDNIHFDGNCNTGTTLLDFTDLKTQSVIIRDCEFSRIHSDLVHVSGAAGFCFENNHIHHCYRSGVLSDNKSPKTRVVGNRFEECGLSMDMNSCVDCCGPDYYVAGNVFCNFGSRAVSAGVYFTAQKQFKSSGIIENNVMYYDGDWIEAPENYTLMDTGAIYITTFSDEAIVRFNRIYDYTGMKDNRGIFCDDGASGFKIYGNVITGISNSYAIDARRTTMLELKIGGRKVNVNNYIGGNVVEGPLRFEGRLAGSGCKKDADYLLVPFGASLPQNDISSVEVSDKDVRVNISGVKDGVIYLPAFSMWRIRRWEYYDQMKDYFARR
ncbi:MAG: right-handed parallel beta-helix repeat-containing protein [Bacteroidales bacterium]|nr:right-handed parallel beta-helix repeat-containing protein [Bacteroidales bacterium]